MAPQASEGFSIKKFKCKVGLMSPIVKIEIIQMSIEANPMGGTNANLMK
jgi:hypothetical protein